MKKFPHRVQEICLGKAPAAAALVLYNQGVVPFLSYVAQFAVAPDSFKISALAHSSVLSILRVPGNSFTRQLTNSVGFVQVLTFSL